MYYGNSSVIATDSTLTTESGTNVISVEIADAVITPGSGKSLLYTGVNSVASADFNVDHSTLSGNICTQQGSVVRSGMNDVDWSSVGQSNMTEYSLTGTSVLGMTIDTVGSYDYIMASSSMMMAGSITINMHIAESVDNLVAGTEFWLFRTTDDIDNMAASYVWTPDIVLNEGLYWDTSRLYREGIVEIKAVIPEPAAITLGLLGLAGLLIRRRR